MQAIVLLAFNDAEEYTYEALKEKTGFTDTELNVQLISLACLDQKVLLAIKPAEAGNKEADPNEEKKGPDASSNKKQSKMSTSKASFKKTITKEDIFRVNDKFRS